MHHRYRTAVPLLIAVAGLALAGLSLPQGAAFGSETTESLYLVEEIPAQAPDTEGWQQAGLGNDDLTTVPIPNTTFYDDNVTQMTISSEGFVALGPYDGPAEADTGPIPQADEVNGIVAPAWANLDVSLCGEILYNVTPETVQVAYVDVAYDREVECLSPVPPDLADQVTAWTEITVENGTIEIHLLQAEGAHTTTTGIEAPGGGKGNQTRRAQAPLRAQEAWRFVRVVPAPTLPPEGKVLDQDDAGSGTDAPAQPSAGLAVDPASWDGTLDGPAEDRQDAYQLELDADDVLNVTITPEPHLELSAGIVSPNGTLLAATPDVDETSEIGARAGAAGNYAVVVNTTGIQRGNYTVTADRISGPDADELHRPHTVVGIPDSGVNPYHDVYHRPNLTAHPCTYIPDYPCDVPALPLSVGMDDYDEAVAADREIWDAVEPGQWYWIPRTNLVAVSCNPGTGGTCILDDGNAHGTGTSSSVVQENPDTLIALKEGQASHLPFLEDGIPVDIFSVSWGHIAPIPAPADGCSAIGDYKTDQRHPLFVISAGNLPWSSTADCWAGQPNVITVGGAYADPKAEEASATKQPDVVSYYCRPTAKGFNTTEMRRFCGTSFAAPTVAGGLSKVLLGVREESGYTGGVVQDVLDPVLDVTATDLRTGLNRTATYDPQPRYGTQPSAPLPLNEQAPWIQWGWGFYDGWIANATLDHLLEEPAGEKPQAAQLYMQVIQTQKRLAYGTSTPATDTAAGQASPGLDTDRPG